VDAKRTAAALGAALIVGLPSGWGISMMSTPLLWRLEPIVNMELAGHSGPSDWVFYLVWAVLIPALFLVFRSVFRQNLGKR
jgi:hypothetical protein